MSRSGLRAAVAALLIQGCAGASRQHKASLNELLASRDWASATRRIEQSKGREYAARDEVLYWLDVAAVLHDAGNFLESDRALDQAEQRLEELYTQSISKGAATFFLNDATDDYRGDPHERSLLHILRALNQAYLGRTDEAVVEARKVSEFLAQLASTVGSNYTYRDDAFAQYLSALLFEDSGRGDDARISYQAARSAYGRYTAKYGTPAPSYDLGAMARGEGEIVFLHFAGVAPRRGSQTLQIAWNDALLALRTSGTDDENAQVKNAIVAGLSDNAITVAFPTYVQDPFRIAGSEIEVAGRRATTLLVEDISAIAERALEDRAGIIRSRAIARAMVKFALSKVAEEQTTKHAGRAWGFLAGLTTRAAGAGLETADTRCWSTIPAQIRMARLRAPAGTQTIAVRYSSRDGVFSGGESLTVEVKPGRRTYVHVRTAL